jgi:hypothetical protein
MKKALLLLLTVLLAVVQFQTVAGQQGQGVRRAARPIPGQYIVVLAGADDPLAFGLQSQQLYAGRLRHVYESALRGFAIRMTAASAQALARDPRVAYVEEDGLAQLNDVQASPPSWGLDRIDQHQRPLDNSYTYPSFATQVHVHVLDTGVLPTHLEFGGRANVAGDFIDDDGDNDPNDIMNDDGNTSVPDGIDCHGHGTHVAATIAGSTYGVAKNALIHGYRVLNCAGSGPISGIVAGIDAVVADGRRPAVANMSLGGSPSTALDAAVRNAITAGITFVVAAGNDNINASLESPSRVAEAITVGATDVTDNKAGFSNYGSVLDVFAPGVGILSAFIGSNTASATLSGTSMASPHVAGVAALYLEQNGNKPPQQVRDAIVGAATAGVLSNIGAGSPNLLVYSAFTIPAGSGRVNVAAAANGGVATASSAWGGYPPSAVTNGDRRGVPYGAGGTWSDGTGNAYPDWVQIDFNGAKAVEEIDIFGAQDNRGAPVEPTPALTCSGCPIDFTVQYWTGVAWQAIPNGVVRDNTLVWRTFTFAPITTSRIRLLVERTLTGWSEVAEVEAYTGSGGPGNTAPTVSLTSPAEGASGVAPASFTLTAQASDTEGPVAKVQFFAGATLLNEDTASPFTFDWTNVAVGTYTLTAVATDGGGLSTPSAPVHVTVTPGGSPGRINVAAAVNGGVATASSAWGGYPPGAVTNGDRRGVPYGAGGTWSDGTGNAYPDWVQIDFNGAKAIEEIDVFGAQDNRGAPVDPTPALTCAGCPIDFTVQYWTGVSWQAIPNGIVRNNTLVWRTFTFAPITATRVRVLVERTNSGWSEVAEVEAYGTDPVP